MVALVIKKIDFFWRVRNVLLHKFFQPNAHCSSIFTYFYNGDWEIICSYRCSTVPPTLVRAWRVWIEPWEWKAPNRECPFCEPYTKWNIGLVGSISFTVCTKQTKLHQDRHWLNVFISYFFCNLLFLELRIYLKSLNLPK